MFDKFPPFVKIWNTVVSNLLVLRELINGTFRLVMLYIGGYNFIMTLQLYLNWGWVHRLIIGWKGVSLTPIPLLGCMPEPNPIGFLPLIFLVYCIIFFKMMEKESFRDRKGDNETETRPSDILRVLFRKIVLGLTIHTLGHPMLCLMVMINNYGVPMDFDLGREDVRLGPVLDSFEQSSKERN